MFTNSRRGERTMSKRKLRCRNVLRIVTMTKNKKQDFKLEIILFEFIGKITSPMPTCSMTVFLAI